MPPVEVVPQASRWHAVVSRTAQSPVPRNQHGKLSSVFSVQRDSPSVLSRTLTQTRLQDWFSAPLNPKSLPSNQQPSTGTVGVNRTHPEPIGGIEYEIVHPNTADNDSNGSEAPVPQPFIYGDDSNEYFWPVPEATTTIENSRKPSNTLPPNNYAPDHLPGPPTTAADLGYGAPGKQAAVASFKRTWKDSGMEELEVSGAGCAPPSKQVRRTLVPVASRWAAVPPAPPASLVTVPQQSLAQAVANVKLPISHPPVEPSQAPPPPQVEQRQQIRSNSVISISSDGSRVSQGDHLQPMRPATPPNVAERPTQLPVEHQKTAPLAPRSATPELIDNDIPTGLMEIESRQLKAMGPCCEEGDCDDCILRLFEVFDPFEDIPEIEEARRLTKRIYVDSGGSTDNLLPPPPLPLSIPRVPEKSNRRLKPIPFSGLLNNELPYLSLQDQQFFVTQGKLSQRFPDASPGQLVHFNFTPVECKIILLSYDISTPPRLPSIYHKIGYVAKQTPDQNIRVPNRRREDIKQFITDCRYDPDGVYRHRSISSLRYNPPSINPSSIAIRRNRSARLFSSQLGGPRSRESRRQHHAEIFGAFKPYRIFNIGSSDVINTIFNPKNPGQFAASCLANSDGYSRPNNLLLGNMDNGPAPTMRILDGHKTRRPNTPATQDFVWSTVSSIGFSCDGSQLYSGSYDKTVKIWDANTSSLLHSIPVSAQVNYLSSDPTSLSLAAGLKDGSITVISSTSPDDPSVQPITASIPAPQRGGKTPTPLSVTTVFHFPTYRLPWLIAGYEDDLPPDTTIRSPSGYLTVFDLHTLQPAFKISPNVSRNFDLCLGHDGLTFCSAVSATSQRSKSVHSHIRRYDPRVKPGSHCRTDLEFDSAQRDVNKITSCGMYYTSSGTDNCTWVFDERVPDRYLHKLQHNPTLAMLQDGQDPEDYDSGVNMAVWMPGGNSDRLVTGGSDGVVKVWDVRRGENCAFVKDLFVGTTQIMSGAVSQDGEWMVIGEESGRVTMLGVSVVDGEEVAPFVVEDGLESVARRGERENADEEESGVRIAREHVESGRFIIEDGVAWEV